jgi:hypothetical protein
MRPLSVTDLAVGRETLRGVVSEAGGVERPHARWGPTPNEGAICGSEVLMIAPSRLCMKKAAATISATPCAPAWSRGFGREECSPFNLSPAPQVCA